MDIELREVEAFPVEFAEGGITYKRAPGTLSTYGDALNRAKNMVVIEHGRADVIILMADAPPPRLSDFCVYISRNEGKKLSGAESEQISYDLTPTARKQHIRCMYDAGQRGIRDMSTHDSRYALPPVNRELTADDISPDHDIIGFDHPRTDIHVRKTKAGITMRTGGNTPMDREALSVVAANVLNKNFTDGEVRKMNLYFEGNTPIAFDVAGTCSTHKGAGEPVSTISAPYSEVCEALVTHEIVHALRAADGRRNTDRDSEEIETEYETTLRLQHPREATGYYKFMPGAVKDHGMPDMPFIEAAVLADRVLATGVTDKPLKGRRLTHDIVPNTVMRSQIATVRSALDFDTFIHGPRTAEHHSLRHMVAEDVDTYFLIKLPDKSTVEHHIRFDEARPPLKEIKKYLKERFGKDIEAWEWHDGKKVRLISRPKKTRSRKRTTKKSVSAKKKTSTRKRAPTRKRTTRKRAPARKPVAAERYGLDAILGVPGGFL